MALLDDALPIVKTYLGVAAADASRDDELTGYVVRAMGQIEAYLGRPLEGGEVVETFQLAAFGSPAPLVLRRAPVVAIASIVLDGVAMEPADFGLDPVRGLLFRTPDRVAPWRGGLVEITYSAGPETAPRWLAEAVALTAANISRYVGGADAMAKGAIRSEEIPGVYNVTYAAADSGFAFGGEVAPVGMIPPAARSLIDLNSDPGV